jgi:hypothetical protein
MWSRTDKPKPPNWTDADSAIIAEKWRAGMSGGEIAKQMGLTRSAVIGRLRRVGLTENDKGRRDPQKLATAPAVVPGGCRYILGDPRDAKTKGEAIYCNQPRVAVTSSYCETHHTLCGRAFDPVPQRDSISP